MAATRPADFLAPALSDYGFDLLMALSKEAGVRCLRPVLPGSATLLMLAGIEAKAFTTVLVALTVLLMLMPGKLMLRATASPWRPNASDSLAFSMRSVTCSQQMHLIDKNY